MALGALKLAAYLAYLGAWGMLLCGVLWSMIPRRGQMVAARAGVGSLGGTVLQAVGLFLMMRTGPEGALRPGDGELVGVLVGAPVAGVLYVWSVWWGRRGGARLVTDGPYGVVRHPMYLAILMILVVTGMLMSAGVRMLLPVGMYVVGTEWRVWEEERELGERYGVEYAGYCRRTRFRYLPGLR